MLPLLACAALLQTPVPDQPARLRTVLENGAVILVEPVRTAKTTSIQLFASSKYVPETESTHGFRHLLEHLMARGQDGLLDRKLESQGCFLQARTLRDAMQIEVTVGPDQLQVGLNALSSLLRAPTFSQERIDHEMRVMRDELAMQDGAQFLSSAAWSAAYGEAGLDPMGTFDSMYRATPDKLAATFAGQFASDGLALVIAGPVELDPATLAAKSVLASLPKGPGKSRFLSRSGKPGTVRIESSGEARAAIVPGIGNPRTVAALAAALAIASEFDAAFVTYTPTARNGLIILGRAEANEGLGSFIDEMSGSGGLYQRGRALAKEWVNRQLRSAPSIGYLRGLLLAQGEGYRPESLLDGIGSMTPAQFEAGIRAFRSDSAVVVAGAR